MGRWVATNGMRLKPYCCAGCGSTPTDEDGPKQAAFCEGVDINWGDSLYICSSCVHVLCDLFGRVEEITHRRVVSELKGTKAALKAITEDYKVLQAKVDRMLDGAKARKEVQHTRKKVTSAN